MNNQDTPPVTTVLLWKDTRLQALRLVSEIIATQDNLDMEALCESMDLSMDELNELMDRIQKKWENHLLNMTPLEEGQYVKHYKHPDEWQGRFIGFGEGLNSNMAKVKVKSGEELFFKPHNLERSVDWQ